MSNLTDLLQFENKFVNFREDIKVINALESVYKTWKAKKVEIVKMGISDVFDFVHRLQEDTELFLAMSALGIESDELKDQINKVAGVLDDIPTKYRKLLIKKLSDFAQQEIDRNPSLVHWRILDIGDETASVDDQFSFNLGAKATLELEAGDSWPRTQEAMPDALLRLGLRGELIAGGNTSIPLVSSAARLGTENSASTRLNYYFNPEDSGEIYAAAVAKRLGHLCNPFSLDSLWLAAITSDLAGVITRVDGSTSLSIEFSVGEGFFIAEELAETTVRLTVGAKLKRTGMYDLAVRVAPGSDTTSQVLEVTLARERSRVSGRNLSLGIDINLAELADRLRQMLKRHLGTYEEILEDYHQYLFPGTYLTTKMEQELHAGVDSILDNSNRTTLKNAIRGVLGLQKNPSLDTLKSTLEKEFSEKLNGVGQVITGKAIDIASEISSRIAVDIGLDDTETTKAVATEIESLIMRIREDLSKRVSELADEKLEQLNKRIKGVGIEVSSKVSESDQALRGVREVIGKYERLLKRLISETENAARTKITAKLTHEEATTSGRTVDVKMSISQNTEATREAFDKLLQGDMDAIVKLLHTPMPGIDFDRENMELARFAAINEKFGLELVFLAFEFGTQSIFDTAARVSSDGSGRVSVTSNANWLRRKSTPREERELRFVDAFELTAASATRMLSVNLSITHQDEALRRKEVIAFLNSFEQASLLPVGETDRAAQQFDEWAVTDDDQELKAEIALSLTLHSKSSIQFLQLSERKDGQLTDACKRKLFRIALRELCESEAYDLQDVAEWAEAVRVQTGMDDAKPRIDVLFDYTDQLHNKMLGNLSPTFHQQRKRIGELTRAARLRMLCMCFTAFVDTMGDIYEANPVLIDEGGWSEIDYLNAQRKLNSHIRNWLRIKAKYVFWIADEAHPRTVAFVGALLALASIPGDDMSTPQLTMNLVRQDS